VLAVLASPPLLLSVVGDDAEGTALLRSLDAAALSRRGVCIVPGARTATVTAVFGSDGDIAAAVADCGLVESGLNDAWLRRFSRSLRSAPVVCADANLSDATLAALPALLAGRPLWLEPVSVAKAARAARLLSSAAFVSPNAAELIALATAARALTDGYAATAAERALLPSSFPCAASAFAALRPCVEVVLDSGCGHVVTTLGALGVLLSWRCQGSLRTLHLPAAPTTVLSTAGAGDALVAGALAGLCAGQTPVDALALGVAAAAFVVSRPENTPPRDVWPSRAALAATAVAVRAAAQEIV